MNILCKGTHTVKYASAILSLLILSTMAACADSVGRMEPEIYLIPEGHKGPFYIIFAVAEGVEPLYEDDFRIYEIPADSVLVTQMSLNQGRLPSDQQKFFVVSEDGQREEISGRLARVSDDEASRKDEQVYIVGGGIGVISALPDLPCDVHYKTYSVGTQQEILESENYLDVYQYLERNGIGCEDILTAE